MRAAFFLSIGSILSPLPGSAQKAHCVPEISVSDDDLTSFGPPRILQGIGNSHFPVTTRITAAQQYFDQGISLLHGFSFFEAYRAFREVIRLDPFCAMGYWGVAKSLGQSTHWTNLRAEALAKAGELAANTTAREQRYIAALAAAQSGAEDGRNVSVRNLEWIVEHHPADVEAKLFLAYETMDGYDDEGTPVGRHGYSLSLLRELLLTNPRHVAVHHYWIHAKEGGKRPEEAMQSANVIGKLAPGSGHMLHMSGHVYYLTGDHRRAHEAFLVALAADETYARSERVPYRFNWNYPHNLTYLIANLADAGRYQEALQFAGKLAVIGTTPERQSAMNFRADPKAASIDAALRLGLWKEASRLAVQEGEISLFAKGVQLFAEGMDAAETGNIDEGRKLAQALESFVWRLTSDSSADHSDLATFFSIAALELRGSVSSAAGDHGEAIPLLLQAAQKSRALDRFDPPAYSHSVLYTLGKAYASAKQWDLAETAFKDLLARRPGHLLGLFGLATTYDRQNRQADATRFFAELVKKYTNADPGLPYLKIATEHLAQMGHQSSRTAQKKKRART